MRNNTSRRVEDFLKEKIENEFREQLRLEAEIEKLQIELSRIRNKGEIRSSIVALVSLRPRMLSELIERFASWLPQEITFVATELVAQGVLKSETVKEGKFPGQKLFLEEKFKED